MTAKQGAGEFTGRHMLIGAVAFFGVIFGVNIGMAVVASTSWTGLVVSNSYVASQEFEGRRLAHEAQRAAGWASSLSFVNGRAVLLVVDANGTAVDLGDVRLEINRPVGGHDDQTLLLTRERDGSYGAPLALAAGVWDAHAIAPATPLGPYELHERFAAAGPGS